MTFEHLELKSKLVGSTFILVCLALIAIYFNYFWFNINFFSVIVFILLFVIVIPPFSVGLRLILHTSIMSIDLPELQKRVMRQQKKDNHPKYPAVINLCGIDGSGKTTQTDLILGQLKGSKLKLKHINLRWAAFFSYPFLAVLRILGFSRWETNVHGVRCVNHYYYRNSAVAHIWSWLFSIDMLFRSTINLNFSLLMGKIVLCDRNPVDALVDLMAETRDYDLLHKIPGKLLLSLTAKNSVIVLLDLDETAAYMRKKDIPNLEYVRQRRQLYLTLAKVLNIPILDASKPRESLYAEIEKILSHRPFWFYK